MADRYYLTTAIFYPSAGPALHSLFEAIGADAIARYQRLLGKDVEMVRFPAESHELTRSGNPVHRVQRFELVLEWFDRFLKNPTGA